MVRRIQSAEEAFVEAWKAGPFGTTELLREYRFHPARRWRVDFAILSERMKVAIEIEGQGRHQTVVGFRRDCEKYNALAAEGWLLLRFPAAVVARDASAAVQEACELICGRVPVPGSSVLS